MTYTLKYPIIFLTLVIGGLFSFQTALSQTYSLSNDTSFLEVHGTSSLHDWHVDAEKQIGNIEVSTSDGFTIKNLSFSVVTESLKSGKSSMDNNTYKALKTKSFKTIDFNLSSVQNLDKITDKSYQISALGEMTICGVTKSIPIDLKIKLVGNQILIEGEKSMLMTDYGIDPPKALLGTIKTGDEIKVIFKTVFEAKN